MIEYFLTESDFLLENKSDSNEAHADDSNIDGESDNETNTSMITESKASISQGLILIKNLFQIKSCLFLKGSSGLLLLAAAAFDEIIDYGMTLLSIRPPLNISHLPLV